VTPPATIRRVTTDDDVKEATSALDKERREHGETVLRIRGEMAVVMAERDAAQAEASRLRLDLAAATAMLAVLCDAPSGDDWQAARRLLAELEADHG
jgi:hypothetical protein